MNRLPTAAAAILAAGLATVWLPLSAAAAPAAGTAPRSVLTHTMPDGQEMGGHDMTGHDMTGHDMTGHDMTGHDMTGHDMTGHDMGQGDPGHGGHDMGHGGSGAPDGPGTAVRVGVVGGFGALNAGVLVCAAVLRRRRPSRVRRTPSAARLAGGTR